MNTLRSFLTAMVFVAGLLVAPPASAQMSLDVPLDGASIGQPFTIAGWAIDAAAPSGTGVDLIHVWAYPNPGSGAPAQFWGEATYGGSRPDIGAAFGGQFTNAGYGLGVWGHAPGVYQIVVFVRSTVTWAFDQSRTATVTLVANPQTSLDLPADGATLAQPFSLGGWALDSTAPGGTGIDAVHVWAYPNPGSGAPAQFWGLASYGGARPDVGSVFGSQFSNSGFGLSITGQAPGVYLLVVAAHNIGADSWDSRAVTVTLTANPQMHNDVPSHGASVYQPFQLSGWAVDLAAGSGPGVDAVEVWAYPNPGSGAEPVYWGAATHGSPRLDVGAAFGGQFTNSGYSFTVQGKPQGVYQVVVFARSIVSGTFNQAWSFNITIGAPPKAITIDLPTQGAFVLQPITLSGWAIDGSAQSGPGVDLVHVYAWPNPGSSAPAVFLGSATYGLARSAIGSAYGARFTNSGFSLNVSGLAPGTYQLTAYARSAASGSFDQSASVIVHANQTAGSPFLSPTSGTYTGPLSITVVSATAGATIRYTLDGSEPTESSLIASSLIPTFGSVTVKTKAFAPGMHPSPTATGTYLVQVPTPTLSPPGGTFDQGQILTMTVNYPATIRYSMDGSDPTETHSVYTNPISLGQNATITARAFMAGAVPSAIASATYTLRVSQPVITPSGGEFGSAPLVEISTASPGATIRYTVDRSEPTATSPIYVAAIQTDGDTTVKAIAFKSGLVPSMVTTETYLTTAVVNAPETSPGSIAVPSVTTTGMNIAGGSVTFTISGASLSSDPADTFVYRNGVRLPAGTYSMTTSGVTLPNILQDGKNRLELEAIDSNGLLLNSTVSAWAGSRSLGVWVGNVQNISIPGATLTVTLVDDEGVEFSSTTNGNGQTSFFNLPSNYTTRLRASAPGYRPVTADISPNWSGVNLWLERANNDFSQNLADWTVSTTRAFVVPHSEGSEPLIVCPDCIGRNVAALAEGTPSTATGDMDLRIDTKNLLGAQTVTRRFTVAPGTSKVTVRYRFQTDEIFTAYPKNGTFRNDSYTVTLRSITTGQQVQDTQTVASLFGTFDANAAVPWQTRALAITAPSEVVELTLSVTNATDNAHMSLLYADILQDTVIEIASFMLNDLHLQPAQIVPLQYLSLSPHPWYGGKTRVHGTMELKGPGTETATSVVLQVLDADEFNILAEVPLSPIAAAALLNRPLPVSISSSQLLFELPSEAMATINQTTDSEVTLRIRLQTLSGAVRFKRFGTRVTKLVRYTNANRVPPDDGGNCFRAVPAHPCGGDGWALPSVKIIAQGMQAAELKWGDFSNMNGGPFPIHGGHRDGNTADGEFLGYSHRDATSAITLIALLNSVAATVDRVLVAFTRAESNVFWRAIRTQKLSDGRCAKDVIRADPSHIRHFDIRFRAPRPPINNPNPCWQ